MPAGRGARLGDVCPLPVLFASVSPSVKCLLPTPTAAPSDRTPAKPQEVVPGTHFADGPSRWTVETISAPSGGCSESSHVQTGSRDKAFLLCS